MVWQFVNSPFSCFIVLSVNVNIYGKLLVDKSCRYVLLHNRKVEGNNCTESPLKALPALCLKQQRAWVAPSPLTGQSVSDSLIKLCICRTRNINNIKTSYCQYVFCLAPQDDISLFLNHVSLSGSIWKGNQQEKKLDCQVYNLAWKELKVLCSFLRPPLCTTTGSLGTMYNNWLIRYNHWLYNNWLIVQTVQQLAH